VGLLDELFDRPFPKGSSSDSSGSSTLQVLVLSSRQYHRSGSGLSTRLDDHDHLFAQSLRDIRELVVRIISMLTQGFTQGERDSASFPDRQITLDHSTSFEKKPIREEPGNKKEILEAAQREFNRTGGSEAKTIRRSCPCYSAGSI
jgi:hypothetical protein